MALNDIETILKTKTVASLIAITNKLGIDVDILRFNATELGDEYTEVYGTSGNVTEELTPIDTIKVLFIGDGMTPLNAFNIGRLEEGYIIDPTDTVKTGDTLSMTRTDSLNRHYRVTEPESIGSTTSIYTIYKIVPVTEK